MTMNDCISREDTLTAFSDYVGSGMSMDDFDALWNIVAKMPSVTPTDSVIDDIKAEINEGIEKYKNKDKSVMFGFMCALYIINKHVEGWNE